MSFSPVTRTPGTADRSAVEVRLEDLSRHYGPIVALDHLDLTLQPGQTWIVLVPDGTPLLTG